jgi:hypothetical protein
MAANNPSIISGRNQNAWSNDEISFPPKTSREVGVGSVVAVRNSSPAAGYFVFFKRLHLTRQTALHEAIRQRQESRTGVSDD